jgi:hypothetical protein
VFLLSRLAGRWTLSWLPAEPLTAGFGGGDAGLDGLRNKVPLELGERRDLRRSSCRATWTARIAGLRRRGRTHPTSAASAASARGRWRCVPIGTARSFRIQIGVNQQGANNRRPQRIASQDFAGEPQFAKSNSMIYNFISSNSLTDLRIRCAAVSQLHSQKKNKLSPRWRQTRTHLGSRGNSA